MSIESIRLNHACPFSARQMFDLVADIERYSDFVPYCTDVHIQCREPAESGEIVYAALEIAYKFLRERYVSKVHLDPVRARVTTHQHEGLFAALFNQWHFVDTKTGCVIEFELEFSFRMPLLAALISPLMESAVARMVNAFEARAIELYGTKP